MLENMGTISLADQPGTFWDYSISVDVLGLLLERIINKHQNPVLNEILIDPLRMQDTSCWVGADKRAQLIKTLDCDVQTVEFMLSDHMPGMGDTYFTSTGRTVIWPWFCSMLFKNWVHAAVMQQLGQNDHREMTTRCHPQSRHTWRCQYQSGSSISAPRPCFSGPPTQ